VKLCTLLLALALTLASGSLLAEELVLNSSYSPPYATNGSRGILECVLAEAFDRVGREVRFRHLPAERALADAQSGHADGVVARIVGMERLYPRLVRVPSASIPSRDFVAFSRSYLPPVRAWGDLAPHNITFVRGWKIIEHNVPPAQSVVPVVSTRRAFELLARGRADVVINARLDGTVMVEQLEIVDVVIHEPPLASLSLYPYLHVRHADLTGPLARALDEMKADGTFDRIYRETMDRYHGR
jgi:polar amino acid transport system substrate-binding protein